MIRVVEVMGFAHQRGIMLRYPRLMANSYYMVERWFGETQSRTIPRWRRQRRGFNVRVVLLIELSPSPSYKTTGLNA